MVELSWHGAYGAVDQVGIIQARNCAWKRARVSKLAAAGRSLDLPELQPVAAQAAGMTRRSVVAASAEARESGDHRAVIGLVHRVMNGDRTVVRHQ